MVTNGDGAAGRSNEGEVARERPPVPTFEGVVLDRSDPEFLAKSPQTYDQIRALGPVVRVPHYQIPLNEQERDGALTGARPVHNVFFLSHYDANSEGLLDSRLLSNPLALVPPEARAKMPPMPEALEPILHSLIMLDPPDHTRLRKFIQPSFGPKAMEALRPRIQKTADDLLDKMERMALERGESAPNRRMDLIKAFAYPLPVTVISDMLGIPEQDRDSIARISEIRPDSRDPVTMRQTHENLTQFGVYLRDLFERKRKEPADDLITQLVQAQEDGDKLNDKELLSMVFILYLAGHITTVNLIGNGVAALLTHPDQLAAFQADPSLVSGVVEETLRYLGPVDYISAVRLAKEDLEICGVHIPKGSPVMVGLGSANRDGSRFPNPHVYDIRREEAHRHLAFGRGIHLCLGAPLARIEGQIAFETLFRRFPDMRLGVAAEELRWGGTAGMRGFAELPVMF